MSETLRDLVVSLSLQTDNFTRNIQSVNKQIKEAESAFKLAGAGVENFEKKSSGLAAKLTTLTRKMELQKTSVEQHQKALEKAKKHLEDCRKNQERYTNELAKANVKVQEAEREHGKESEAYKKAEANVKKLTGQVEAEKRATQNASDAVTVAATKLNNTEAELKATTHEVNKLSSAWTRAGTVLVNFSDKAKKVSKGLTSAGRTMTRSVTTPLVTLGTAAVKASIDFEDSFASVRKTVEATEEDFERLAAASKQMSTEVAASTSEINEVMATGGQLGVSADGLAEFTRVMIDLGNSCEDLSATDAATMLAKFANIMDSGEKQYKNMGSTLVALGNNFATTEGDIMELAMRLAGAGKQVGLSEAQVLGFATALSSVGINAEAGGSAFSKALVQMEVAAATGGQALDDFAKVSGMTADEFKALWDSNPAAAFQAFIEGLAQLDDEGESAIVVLNEIGISEVRLRDTMLRSVNATELFARALGLAGEAWDENNALTEEANKRYATTASKLTNLKNKAVLVAQQLGDDMNPTIQNLIGSVSDLLDKFMGLDEQQRMSIVTWGAAAASIGPALLVMGKVGKIVGGVTGAVGKGMQAIGKFSGAVKDADGGMSGLVKVVGSSKLAMAALTAAVIYGAYKLYDYASGAKAAREALEGMNKTANEWKNTAAETFYESGEGLAFFGMSTDDFVTGTKQTAKTTTSAVQDWMDGMIEVWSDGKYETDAIVKEWQDSSSEVSKETLEHMKELRTQAQESGDTAKAQELDADIAALEALDKRISDNLRFFQGKTLTDANKTFWQGLMDEKQEILLKWGFEEEPVGGNEAYEAIAQKVEAARARAQATGKEDADATVYEEAVLAASQGFASINKQINDQYDAEYANIQLMADGAEKTAALEKLNADYVQQRTQAANEYAAAMKNVISPVWEQSDVQKAKADVAKMASLMATYSTQDGNQKAQAETLEKMNALAASMSEGSLTEYYTLLTQIQSLLDYGIPESTIKEWFPEIDYSTGLREIAKIQEFLMTRQSLLPGLATMFGEALPEEVVKIATDLDMTGAQERWNEFAENPGAITTEAIISGYSEDPTAIPPQPKSTLAITGYDLQSYNAFIKENPVEVKGIVRLGTLFENPEDAIGADNVQFYDETGISIPVTGVVADQLGANDLVAMDEDGTMHVIITTEIAGTPDALEDAIAGMSDKAVRVGTIFGSDRYNWGFLNGVFGETTIQNMETATNLLRNAKEQSGGILELWGALRGYREWAIGNQLDGMFGTSELAEIEKFISEYATMVKNGDTAGITPEMQSTFQTILDFYTALSEAGYGGDNIIAGLNDAMTTAGWDGTMADLLNATQLGEDIAAGIGEGQANYDFTNDAETTVSNDESALRTAADSHSPAVRMKPLGADIAAGIGEGMAGYDFSAYASSTVGSLQSAMSAALLSGSLRAVGLNAMYGMAAGIRAGRANVISAMRSAAQAAVSAAKTALQIHSPSRVFRDEVGAMTMKGFGEGVLDETRAQAKIISNAARYLTSAAGSSAVAATNDNRKTYNNDNSTSFSFAGATFSVRSDQDVHDLAVEIATLTRRNQRGRGYRMA